MKLLVELEVSEVNFLSYYNRLDYTVTNDLISGTDMTKPFDKDDISTIVSREIEGWINGIEVKKVEKVS